MHQPARHFQRIVGGILAMHGPQRVCDDGEKVGGGSGDKGGVELTLLWVEAEEGAMMFFRRPQLTAALHYREKFCALQRHPASA